MASQVVLLQDQVFQDKEFLSLENPVCFFKNQTPGKAFFPSSSIFHFLSLHFIPQPALTKAE